MSEGAGSPRPRFRGLPDRDWMSFSSFIRIPAAGPIALNPARVLNPVRCGRGDARSSGRPHWVRSFIGQLIRFTIGRAAPRCGKGTGDVANRQRSLTVTSKRRAGSHPPGKDRVHFSSHWRSLPADAWGSFDRNCSVPLNRFSLSVARRVQCCEVKPVINASPNGNHGRVIVKRLFLAGAAISAIMAGSAFAADMPLKAPPPVLAYDWSGFYIGGVIGGAWSRTDSSDPGTSALSGRS